ncbi:MAG: tRNA preQ1(34) S-adenosylmethionine ribosyltransferase-isomerase QueA [Pseudomonadota bacterium]
MAQAPTEERTASMLLWAESVGESESFRCDSFSAIRSLLAPGDLLVVNNTRVLPARIDARKPTGGRVEIMLERLTGERTALVQLGSNKKIRDGQTLEFHQQKVSVIKRLGRFFEIESDLPIEDVFLKYGVIPLPPYINRNPSKEDICRYQTVYASAPGAVAAPTAGLHFDSDLMASLRADGINWGEITLHVGAGTFTPVQVQSISEHTMHKERYTVSEDLVKSIRSVKAAGKRVVAVGTTVVRALESAANEGELVAGSGDTSLFITPGFRFNVADALITNFHLPKSTLIMMVSAFATRERVMAYYAEAIRRSLRFFSYGDAMYVERMR